MDYCENLVTASQMIDESILMGSSGIPLRPEDLHLISIRVLPHDLCPLPTVCVMTASAQRFYFCVNQGHLQVSVIRPALTNGDTIHDMWFVGSSILTLDAETLVGIVRCSSNPSHYQEAICHLSFDQVLNVCPMQTVTPWKECRSDGSDYHLAGLSGVLYEQNEQSFLVIQPDEVICLYRCPLYQDWIDVGMINGINE